MIAVVILLSAVQAATEFFPVSSSAHLVLLHTIVSLGAIDPFRFDLAVHVGTLIAVLWAFWSDLRVYVREKLGRWVVVATLIPVIVGAVFSVLFGDLFRTPRVAAFSLALGGIVLLFAERFSKKERTFADLTFRDVFVVGLSQVAAFIPGVSRSGATIITALFRNLKADVAVRLSFLLSIPIILAAAGEQIPFLFTEHIPRDEVVALLLGVVSSALFGYVVIRVFLRLVATRSFAMFAWYRILLALAVLLLGV